MQAAFSHNETSPRALARNGSGSEEGESSRTASQRYDERVGQQDPFAQVIASKVMESI